MIATTMWWIKMNIKYGEKRFSICRWNSYTLQCGMWLWNRDSEFTKWQHPAMWYVALGWHAIEFARWQHPAMWHIALESWHRIRQCGRWSWDGMPFNSPKRPPYWNSTLVSISTTSTQSTCYFAPVSEILCYATNRMRNQKNERTRMRPHENGNYV